jgi:tryptophan 2,3-dioxygenase
MEFTYGDYLKVPELLELQQLRSDAEHDEMLFIVVHQVYELWFKQILHELDRLGYQIDNDELVRGEHQLVRILKILKTLVQQIDVLETMTPLEFISFRSFLGSASGFQSAQFREIEFALGAKDPEVLERFVSDPERARLTRRYREPSIWARFCDHLARQGLPIDSDVLERPTEAPPRDRTRFRRC